MTIQNVANARDSRSDNIRHDQPEQSIARDDDEPEHYLIGDLAKDYGVTLRALRFYEDKGLLRPGRRGAVRLYSARDRERLAIILKGKQLGFTLGEIAGMIERNDGDFAASADGLTLRLSVDQISEQIVHLEAQKRDIESAIAELVESRAQVSRLAG